MNGAQRQLQRTLGTPGAVLLGLGAIVGTGVYVSIGLGAGIAGAALLPALAIAAFLAACNGLSSAQLAAAMPVSGGTYEYAHRYLDHWFGFTAGWLFLVAKCASAATAALGFAGYLCALAGIPQAWQAALALALLAGVTLIVLAGMRASSRANAFIVLLGTGGLLVFVAAALPQAWQARDVLATQMIADASAIDTLLHAAALMFVAFTGYGRVATLGEEVAEPRTTIPRAILWTVLASFLLYLAVAAVATAAVGASTLGVAAERGLPLSHAAERLGQPLIADIVAVGALIAMTGVLLNLLLGLSRVVLAMARRRDMPALLARLDAHATTAPAAVLFAATVIALIVLIGDIRAAWSFSAFTVLLYYAITNLAALRVAATERFVPRAVAILGLAGCAGLAWFVDARTWIAGSGVIAAGLAWHLVARGLARAS